jgi:drug/metabolite transporter (DMT)-like permease
MLVAVFLVVTLMTLGQLLFKATAVVWQQHGTPLATPVVVRMAAALVVYGAATLAWMWVLQKAPLSMAYPIVAFTFVLVPLGAHWLFGEAIGLRYVAGTLLIVAGVAVATSASRG